jgi:glycosyltransferase involved in cell wall biosynthesis
MGLPIWLSLAILLATVFFSMQVALGARKIAQLKDVPHFQGEGLPKVSVIVSALNEAETISPALQSILSLEYPNLEVIAIDDRSTDATGSILDSMAKASPILHVLHISELPSGWLGKNHALHQGALLATGEYLLFTDADVMFESTAIGRAVNYCEKERADHLTLLFDVVAKTALLSMLVLSFSANFMARFKPWKVATSDMHFLGAGGFNLVRRNAYLKAGGHAAISMAVLDDMMLGKLIKSHGFRQRVLYGQAMVGVEWYRSTREMIRGLQKNAFAAFDFQIGQLLAVTLLMLAFRVWPWAALFLSSGYIWWASLATVLISTLLYVDLIRSSGWNYRCLVFMPIVSLVELGIWWRGSIKTLMQGGIEWRGTYYSLQQLKQIRLQAKFR